VKILLVEDERMTRVALTGTLRKEGHEVIPCPDGNVAMAALDGDRFELVLTDLNLPGPDGMNILTRVRNDDPEVKVIIMTAYASTETAVEALRQGAYDYVIKPFQTDELLAKIRRIDQLNSVVEENRILRQQVDGRRTRFIVGNSPGMKKLKKTIENVGPGEFNVLIQGPSGTGKELVARAVHEAGPRKEGPFVAVNCAAIPETLLESEMFGYRKGAFTGADRDHDGYFSRADGGTLFLDDIDDLPLTVQVKLLRVIQEREIEPVGGGATIPVDFRLVCATKENLRELSDQGSFRADLYYRLNVIPLMVPTLAERKGDIPFLVDYFVKQRLGKETHTLSPEGFEALMAHEWPGNVRELENVVERMIAFPGVPVTELFDTPLRRHEDGRDPPSALDPVDAPPPDTMTAPGFGADYREYMTRCEQDLLQWALAKANNNISVAARLLGLPRSTLRSKLDKEP
jgi:DNA-binding NtrC family response regulator